MLELCERENASRVWESETNLVTLSHAEDAKTEARYLKIVANSIFCPEQNIKNPTLALETQTHRHTGTQVKPRE